MPDLRILFVYQALSLGGVESVIRGRMLELLRRGVDARAVFFRAYDGPGLADLPGDRVLISADRQELRRYLAAFQPDWVVHFDTPDLVADCRDLPGCRQVYEFHTTAARNASPLRSAALLAALSGVIVPSAYQQQAAQKLTAGRTAVEIVPNGLTENFFQPAPEQPPVRHPVIAWVGRLEAHKNWQSFLDIAAPAARSGKALIWLVGGQRATEQQQQMLWDFIRRENLALGFRWFPEIAPQEMPGFYQAVARSGGCLVSTSKNESFGLSVLEAMAGACPVVAPAVGGLAELIEEARNGFLYRPGEWAQAAQSVLQIISDRPLQRSLGESAAQRARQFSIPQVVDRFLQVLEQLSTSRGVKTG